MQAIKLQIVAILTLLAGCSGQTEQKQGAGFYPPECKDDSHALACAEALNSYDTSATALDIGRSWFAFSYVPAQSFTIGKVCVSAPDPTSPTLVHLLADSMGAPGQSLVSGNVYASDGNMLCTLDPPFDFTADVTSGVSYWIASNAIGPYEAGSGVSVAYWTSDIDPSESPTWTSNCVARFIARIEPKGQCQ